MFYFEKPKIEIADISEDNKYGRFVVEPLERGYGITLGNSLRRVLLSALPGAAAVGIKINGVFQPVRVAITASAVSLPLHDSIALLGLEETEKRINRALNLFN